MSHGVSVLRVAELWRTVCHVRLYGNSRAAIRLYRDYGSYGIGPVCEWSVVLDQTLGIYCPLMVGYRREDGSRCGTGIVFTSYPLCRSILDICLP